MAERISQSESQVDVNSGGVVRRADALEGSSTESISRLNLQADVKAEDVMWRGEPLEGRAVESPSQKLLGGWRP